MPYAVIMLLLVAAVLLAGLLGVAWGPSGDELSLDIQAMLTHLRLTRMLAALVVGAGLAVAGVLLQGLFRNPLADPGIIGTSAGATLGGMVVVVVSGLGLQGSALPASALIPLGCIAGAFVSLWVLLAVARVCRDTTGVLLAGVVLAMLFASIGTGMSAWAQGYWELSRALMAFSFGGLEGVGWRHIGLAAPLVIAAVVAGWWWWARALDVLLGGEDEAASLGVDMSALRWWVIIWATLAVAGTVAIAGNVAFVGLLVPHLMRGLVGHNHRRLLPAAALGGGLLVLCCDTFLRLLPAAAGVPLGVLTGLLGAPLFLFLLLRGRRAGQL